MDTSTLPIHNTPLQFLIEYDIVGHKFYLQGIVARSVSLGCDRTWLSVAHDKMEYYYGNSEII